MAGLGSKTKHAAHPLSSVRSLAATLLSLAIIFAKATATLETNPHTGKQPAKMPELTTGCLISETEVSQERSLLGQEVNGSGCSELHETSITRVRRNAQSFAEKPKMTATLAFVFDTTGSMSEDMAQARQGAKAILKAFTERDEVPVSNYILAPFNDPEIPAMTITENPDVFVNALNNLRADGGGDCPERACAGILNALRTAHPQSYLYVFTDAPAKDYQVYDKILEVNQRKRSQVTFILSGLCRHNEESKTVYDRIAGESGGQVFSVTKHDIKTVLDFVRDTLRGGDETIYSVRRPTPISKEPHSELFNMTVEIGLEELRITLTGNKPAVIVFNPLGVIIKNFVTILTLPNVIVVGILNPEPAGVWSVRVTIQPKTSQLATIPNGFALQVRATGVSYKILQGFSIQPSQSLQETANRPLEGTKNYLLVAIKPLQKSEEQKISLEKYTWDYVDIRKLDGEIYSTQALKPLPRTEDDETQTLSFLAGPFEIPLDLFTLAFHGFDENGNPISRMPLNAISPAPISPPYVTMEPELEAMLGEPLSLHCAVESLTPFTLDWYKNGDFFLGNLSYEQSHDAQLMLQSANKDDEGLYTCKATNSKGSTVSPIGTSLKIIVPPVIVRMRATKTEILENETVMLECVVESENDYTITWTLKQEGNIERLSNETHCLSRHFITMTLGYMNAGLKIKWFSASALVAAPKKI
ncbi:hemicentin-2-like [Ischnura elegans]|uniref:hemicentin-2-like n=1 Tax=Ischnura elegans TaxID=197161 RepID=UPI001ED8A214|nr:hemicentin-2-like [Ischnura elegans]